ncbi:MAG: TlpA family protein disulfide reductase [Flavobacteriaceae bacterium]|nr:TlpA family protein disulfide reductase [Flavobacteriaceae bacterium]
MKISKSQRSNIIFVLILGIVFFTPIGGQIKEFASKMLAFSPSIEDVEDRVVLNNYQWNLKGQNTDDINFNDVRGKVVIVNFWATWCPPCRAEMPSFQKLYDDYKDKVVFLFVTNDDVNKVKGFMKKNNYDLPSYNEYNRSPSAFNVSSIPASYLIDKKGAIIIDKVGAADWNSDKVRELLDDLLAE